MPTSWRTPGCQCVEDVQQMNGISVWARTGDLGKVRLKLGINPLEAIGK
ncbi:hypothetical protein APV28_4415 [Comamonas testosteroni]|nr:hypothetical protein APV28_4415 [Comamonas testosteroni]